MKEKEKTVDQINEEEYQKSKQDKENKENAGTKKASGNVKETGFTDGMNNFIVAQNGVLTEAQEKQIKDGKWLPYTKSVDGTINVSGKKSEPAAEEDSKKK